MGLVLRYKRLHKEHNHPSDRSQNVPPLADHPSLYPPSQVSAAARRILAAYLTHNRVSAVEAARLAIRVEAVLAELVAGGAAAAMPPQVEVEAAPRRGRRVAAAKSPRVSRPRRVEAQAAFDLTEEMEEVETEETEETEEAEIEAPAPVPAPPVPAVEILEEIDLLTGGPLPPAHEPEYPVMPQMAVAPASPAPAGKGKKRKRPPRPASQRRAARVAAIEQMLVAGAEPGEDES
jgi:hypothetical protein